MKRLIAVVAPLALVACGAPAPERPKEPPPIVEAGRQEPEPRAPAPIEDEPAKAKPAPASRPAPPTKIDLGGPPTATPPPAPEAPGATDDQDPTRPDAGGVAMSKRLERERLEKRVTEAEAKIAELEKRRLAISNPFLPRPELPPDEAAAWEGLDGVQRRERVDKQLEAARDELEAAQKDLEALDRR